MFYYYSSYPDDSKHYKISRIIKKQQQKRIDSLILQYILFFFNTKFLKKWNFCKKIYRISLENEFIVRVESFITNYSDGQIINCRRES